MAKAKKNKKKNTSNSGNIAKNKKRIFEVGTLIQKIKDENLIN